MQAKTVFKLIVVIIAVIIGGMYVRGNDQPSEGQRMEESEKVVETVVSCEDLGEDWVLFSDGNTSLTFCYQKVWGDVIFEETLVDASMRSGTEWFITFSDEPAAPSAINGKRLQLSYATLDYKGADAGHGNAFDWSALNFELDESELATLFTEENVVISKLSVNGKNVLKVKKDFVEPLTQQPAKSLDYYLPNITINETPHNLRIAGAIEQEAQLDMLVETIQ